MALAIPRPGEALPPQLVERRDAEHPRFYQALALIDSGDVEGLRQLLQVEPELVSARGYLDTTAYRDGGLHGGQLLHTMANNPARQPRMPNLSAIAGVLLEAGAEVDALTARNRTTLGLVVAGQQLRRQGVAVAAIEQLLAAQQEALRA